jgi:hypothetical protein
MSAPLCRRCRAGAERHRHRGRRHGQLRNGRDRRSGSGPGRDRDASRRALVRRAIDHDLHGRGRLRSAARLVTGVLITAPADVRPAEQGPAPTSKRNAELPSRHLPNICCFTRKRRCLPERRSARSRRAGAGARLPPSIVTHPGRVNGARIHPPPTPAAPAPPDRAARARLVWCASTEYETPASQPLAE